MAKRVTQIPATLNRFTSAPVYSAAKRKVAGYARVSTDLEEQQSSYEAQMDYYRSYITSRSDWEFVGMYSDEGITATTTKHRDGFNSMIEDALAGKINLIITKSISRFARNTVDSLTTVRKLKDKGVEVYFEKENIWTLDSKGELLITIMSSLAQEESRSISENTTWGKRKAFADGKASVTFTRFLGYDKGFIINEEEADTVRLIYKLFLMGLSFYAITKELERRGRKTATGNTHWNISAVESVLTNEKYKGDALLQKEYTVDFLQKKRKKNEGEIPQFYVEGHHAAIIDTTTFDLVQAEILKRRRVGKRFSGISVFSAKIRCGDCGGWYGSKVWHSNDKYRKVVYRCNQKYKGECKCGTPHLAEEEIKTFFITAVNHLVEEKEETLVNLSLLMDLACNTDALEQEREQTQSRVTELERSIHALIDENARVALDQDEYDHRYAVLYGDYEKGLARLAKIGLEVDEKKAHGLRIQKFIDRLMELEGEQTIFDEQLWGGIVEYMTVYEKEKATFTFVGGIEVTVG